MASGFGTAPNPSSMGPVACGAAIHAISAQRVLGSPMPIGWTHYTFSLHKSIAVHDDEKRDSSI